jgi:hypothetical protein
MTATPESLEARFIFKDPSKEQVDELIAPSNVSLENLLAYVRDVATYCDLPDYCPVTKNNNGTLF